ncbi:MAG: hypothetical protein CSA74_06400 [Rhodobacterales bacterium]|nr:MAG: hypothetical protein CSA74_06400 [Rhodobacterales bacterium]
MAVQGNDLPKVAGTQVRGKVYHLNLRIRPEIQHLFDGKTHLRGSLHTSDPKEAQREVERRKAELAEKEQAYARQAEVDDIVSHLTPEQRAAYDQAGGLEGLLETFEHLRNGALPATDAAADPSDTAAAEESGIAGDTGPGEYGDQAEETRWDSPGNDHGSAPSAPDEPDDLARDPDEIEAIDENWPLPSSALALVSHDRSDMRDSETEYALFTLADLLEEYALQLDPDSAQTVRHIVRLFTEYHGDIAFDELTIAHLDAFANAAHGLPADMMARLADGTHVRDLPYAEMVAWTVANQARPMSETTRFHYVSALKQLMAFGVPRYRRGDPWSDYRLQIVRREPVEEPPRREPNRFAPSQWTFAGAMARAFELTVLLLIAALLYLLWQSRF